MFPEDNLDVLRSEDKLMVSIRWENRMFDRIGFLSNNLIIREDLKIPGVRYLFTGSTIVLVSFVYDLQLPGSQSRPS